MREEYDVYYIMAREFGIKPSEVDEMPRSLVVYFLDNLKNEYMEMNKSVRYSRDVGY